MADLHSPREWMRWIARNTKRIVVFLLGSAVVLAGVMMLVLPGPGILVIVLGLVILGTEFAWAEWALDHTTRRAAGAANMVTGTRNGKIALAASGIAMIVGGAVLASISATFRVVGLSIAFAGVIGLVTLLPAVQRWIEVRAQPSTPLAELE